jgi:hypothetical protein
MIRVWNYNKERTYAGRGTRELSISTDDGTDVEILFNLIIKDILWGVSEGDWINIT